MQPVIETSQAIQLLFSDSPYFSHIQQSIDRQQFPDAITYCHYLLASPRMLKHSVQALSKSKHLKHSV